MIEDFFHLVVHLELRISTQIFEKIRNGPTGILRAWGKLIHEKNQKSKILWHCPFKKHWHQFFRTFPYSSTMHEIDVFERKNVTSYCELLRYVFFICILLNVLSKQWYSCFYPSPYTWVSQTHPLAPTHRYLSNEQKSKKGTASLTTRQALTSSPPTRGCILGRIWDKILKTFALYYSQSSSPIIRNASKGGKPNRKPYHLMVSEIYTKQSNYEENSSLFINSVL